MTKMRDQEEAMRVLPHLVYSAQLGMTITYKGLGERTSIHFHGRIPHVLRYIRDDICFNHGLPCLTAIVVSSSTGVPGKGFLPRDEGYVGVNERRKLALVYQKEVYEYGNWQSILDRLGLEPIDT